MVSGRIFTTSDEKPKTNHPNLRKNQSPLTGENPNQKNQRKSNPLKGLQASNPLKKTSRTTA
jgi:hypothetical protein